MSDSISSLPVRRIPSGRAVRPDAVEVRDSKGKLIEHLALDSEENCESIYEYAQHPKQKQFPPDRTSNGELPTSRESTTKQTYPDVEITEHPASNIELREVRGEPVDMSDDLFKLLEDLEGYIQGCRHVPMTDKVLVGEETLLDYIDRIRSLLPEELHQARLMVKDREHLMDDARVEAERIFAKPTSGSRAWSGRAKSSNAPRRLPKRLWPRAGG